jgi:hypothetical protein
MTRRYLLALALTLGLTGGMAHAANLTYVITLNTPNFGVPGWIDFSFNQTNALDSLSAVADVYNFQQTGYVFDTVVQTSLGVTGSLGLPPVSIPNDQGAANFFTQSVLNWGSFFLFSVTFSGPAVNNAAPDGSQFLVTLYDQSFNPLVAPLPLNEVADVFINPDGSLAGLGSTFAGGSAASDPAPEPGTWVMAIGALGVLGWRKLQRA